MSTVPRRGRTESPQFSHEGNNLCFNGICCFIKVDQWLLNCQELLNKCHSPSFNDALWRMHGRRSLKIVLYRRSPRCASAGMVDVLTAQRSSVDVLKENLTENSAHLLLRQLVFLSVGLYQSGTHEFHRRIENSPFDCGHRFLHQIHRHLSRDV